MYHAKDTPDPVVEPLAAPVLARTAAQTLTEQLAERFAARIRDRLLAPGARLPSVRQCAAQHGLNPSTVVAAYDQLLAQGLVLAQRNRGFFVRDRAPLRESLTARPDGAAQPNTHPEIAQPLAAPVNAAALIRGMFHPAGSRPQPGMGAFPPDWMVSTFMQAAVRRVTTPQALADSSLRYGEPLGDGHLRRVLADRLQGHGLASGAATHHHHSGRHPCAGHREPHPAETGRLRDGGRTRLGGGVCPPGCHGHAHLAGATRPCRA